MFVRDQDTKVSHGRVALEGSMSQFDQKVLVLGQLDRIGKPKDGSSGLGRVSAQACPTCARVIIKDGCNGTVDTTSGGPLMIGNGRFNRNRPHRSAVLTHLINFQVGQDQVPIVGERQSRLIRFTNRDDFQSQAGHDGCSRMEEQGVVIMSRIRARDMEVACRCLLDH